MNRTLVVLLSILLAVAYVGLHVTSYVPVDQLPNDDFANVLGALSVLNHPAAFADNPVATFLVNRHTRTAPIYYYIIALPLSQLVHPATALKLLGVTLSLLLGAVAGAPWRRASDVTRSVLVSVAFLHMPLHVNPLPGFERSFSVVILAAYPWLQDHAGPKARLVLLAAATGLYPPAALLVLTALGLDALDRVRREGRWTLRPLGSVLLALVIFLVVLSPYLISLTDSGSTSARAANWVQPLNLDGTIPTGLALDLLYDSFRGALLRGRTQLALVAVFAAVCVLQRSMLRTSWRLRRSYVLLLAAVGVTWTVSHLVYPLLYQPIKFSSAALPLVVLMVVGDNLPATVRRLRNQWGDDSTLARLLIPLAVTLATGYFGYRLLVPPVHADLTIPSGQILLGIGAGLPLVVAVFLYGVVPRWTTPGRASVLGTGILMVFMFYPHCFTTCSLYGEGGRPLPFYGGMFEALETTSPTSTVVGPPSLMDPVPAFARRSVHLNHEYSNASFVCDRIRNFTPIYFSSSPRNILRYMQDHDLQYLVVDRRDFRDYYFYSCGLRFDERPDPVLDRHFQDATWSRDREVYLLSRETLRRTFNRPSSP